METIAPAPEAKRTLDGTRILQEGYGPGAWHGPDLKAALADVTRVLAYWRPAAGRHNIAEIALHHAYCARTARTQISGVPAEPFVLDGDDWFEVSDERVMKWADVLAAVDLQQRLLADLVTKVEAGAESSPLPVADRFGTLLGITCHAIYHAGQIQLIKRLHE